MTGYYIDIRYNTVSNNFSVVSIMILRVVDWTVLIILVLYSVRILSTYSENINAHIYI